MYSRSRASTLTMLALLCIASSKCILSTSSIDSRMAAAVSFGLLSNDCLTISETYSASLPKDAFGRTSHWSPPDDDDEADEADEAQNCSPFRPSSPGADVA